MTGQTKYLLRLRAMFVVALLAVAGVAGLTSPANAYTLTCGTYGSTPSFNCVSYTGFTGQRPWGYWVDANGHNCTNYASYRLWQNGVTNPGNLGNAMDWDNRAIAYGIPVNTTPTVGSIAVWEANHFPAYGSGHVAYVEAVTSSYIDISEDNWGGTTMRARYYTGEAAWPDHFIHFKDVTVNPPAPEPAPDWDNDGVSDNQDWCPHTKGSANNHGCPPSITQVSGDLNGDGKDDVISISRNGDNSPSISWLQASSGADPSLADPVGLLALPAPAWNVDGLKWAVGDFNGDGKDDLFAASGSGYGAVNMYVFLSTGTGLAGPTLVKQPPHPSWQWQRLEHFAGDVNGDGKDDIVTISRNGDNSPSINLLNSTSTGTTASLADPLGLLALPAPAWNVDNLKWTVGDFNGDGKDDLFAASGSQVDSPSMYILQSTGSTLATPTLAKQPNPSAWKWDRLTFMKANLDGDTRDDIMAVSRDLDNAPAIHWFQSTSTPTAPSLADPVGLLGLSAPAWNVSNLKLAIVDHNGDGKDDLFAASGSLYDPVSMYLFTSNGALSLSAPVLVKQPNPQYWVWWRLQF